MIKKYEDIIDEFQKLGYEYSYYPNSHTFTLINNTDNEVVTSIHVHYKYKNIIFHGGFGKEELILIKRIIEKMEVKIK